MPALRKAGSYPARRHAVNADARTTITVDKFVPIAMIFAKQREPGGIDRRRNALIGEREVPRNR